MQATAPLGVLNPYLKEFLETGGDKIGHIRRGDLVKKYAWGVPNAAALNTISKYGPIVEIGAGTGYWARLLADIGVDVVAYDSSPPTVRKNKYGHKEQYFPVRQGHPEMSRFHEDRSLMLCWPPYARDMAARALEAYKGKYLIYIGEDYEGCNADCTFFTVISRQYTRVESVAIPQWWGLHDMLNIYERKGI